MADQCESFRTSQNTQDVYQYFVEATDFLAKHDFLYDFKVTEFFIQRVWTKLPNEWTVPLTELSYEEMRDIPYGFMKEGWPPTLTSFLTSSYRLSCPRLSNDLKFAPFDVAPVYRTGMTPKKLHEVSHLAAVVDTTCRDNGCSRIVDIGSGLGYLDLVLSKQFGYQVLGLESQTLRVHGAEERMKKSDNKSMKESSLGSFVTRHFELTNNELVVEMLESLVEDVWPLKNLDQADSSKSGDVCLVGLHCCGDLTPAVLNAFSLLPRVKCLVCLSCCYHRMTQDDTFLRFPLSVKLKEVLHKACQQKQWSLSRYALRLAAQETRTRWKNQTKSDHEYHIKNVAFRSLLELAVLRGKLSFMKERRKIVRKQSYVNFESYVEALFQRNSIHSNSGDDVKWELINLHEEYQKYFSFIQPITLLQVMLQPVIEQLITADRVEYLREKGFNAEAVTVFDDRISPRNYAILASKEENIIGMRRTDQIS